MIKKNISIIGLGYIGLPTAAILADTGHKVLGVDINTDVVDGINSSKTHFYEPDLDELVINNIKNGNLRADIELDDSDIFIICVPTPFKVDGNNKTPDMSYIEDASLEISKHIKKGDLVILESTSPVGTTQKVAELIQNQVGDCNGMFFAYCPERVLPGNIISELTDNDRIVGGLDNASTAIAADFYKTFVKGCIHLTNSNTAEMCKLTENSYRDVNIAFANELSLISEKYDIDERELIKLANFHPRVDILQPGVGVGGHCIAVDPWFLISDSPNKTNLIRTAREVNIKKTEWVKEKVEEKIDDYKSKNGYEPLLACMGITFKPNVDDIRESPALEIALSIKNNYKQTLIVEPNLEKIDGVDLAKLNFALEKADIFVFLVGHNNFSKEDFLKKINKKDYLDFTGIVNFNKI
tara:strand:+ start:1601 stop:2833 length:1233 start_codon:yes stop_codon:yes gene_type:complete